MRDYKRTIAANSSVSAGVIGNFIKLKGSTSTVRIIAENENGREVANLRMSVGTSIRISEQYQRVRIENETGSPLTCDLILGYGDVQDSELSGTISTKKGTRIANSGHAVNIAAGKLLDADETRRSVIVNNEDDANNIYIGSDNSVTAANGLRVQAGQSLTIEDAAAAEIWAVGAADGLSVKTLGGLD